jgi:hypothetical protein
MASDQDWFDNFINLIMFNPINYYPAEAPTRKPGFWRRQFQLSPTNGQAVFDLSFGVIAPIACFFFDPLVFQSGIGGPPLFPSYQTFVYLFSGCQIFLLCFWLLRGPHSGFATVTIGAGLLSGGVFCAVIGCLLAPYSVIGLLVVLGVLGFIPFITSIVYLRNAWRALSVEVSDLTTVKYVAAFILGATLAVGIPASGSIRIHSAAAESVNEILHADRSHASNAAQRLKVLRYVATADVDRIVDAYVSESDTSRKEILKACYREITGEDIEFRAHIVRD